MIGLVSVVIYMLCDLNFNVIDCFILSIIDNIIIFVYIFVIIIATFLRVIGILVIGMSVIIWVFSTNELTYLLRVTFIPICFAFN